MFPFRVQIKPGAPVYEQVIYAVQKAILKGQLKPGSRFPSVRQLSQELRINPNTAHKIVTHLTAEGLLDVQPGIGTVVQKTPRASVEDKSALLKDELERLVVEAKGLSITLSEITRALEQHWEKYHE
jgi:GntR family transcriptional regulator